MTPVVHKLMTWRAPFEAVRTGVKRHEVRENDRGFAVGDVLQLREYCPRGIRKVRLQDNEHWSYKHDGAETGEELFVRVTYISQAVHGLPLGLCVMSIELCDAPDGFGLEEPLEDYL